MKLINCCLALVIFTLSSVGGATVPRAQQTGLELELNKVEQYDGGCRLTFRAGNHFKARLEGFTVEFYLLDPKGVALQSVQFTFGAVAAAKARFAKFDLKERNCSEIGEIFVNEFKSCKAETDITQQCQNGLILKNLTPLRFTDTSS